MQRDEFIISSSSKTLRIHYSEILYNRLCSLLCFNCMRDECICTQCTNAAFRADGSVTVEVHRVGSGEMARAPPPTPFSPETTTFLLAVLALQGQFYGYQRFHDGILRFGTFQWLLAAV